MRKLLSVLALVAIGCSGDDEEPVPEGPVNPFQEVVDLGIDRYVGQIQPASQSEPEAGVTSYEFEPASGPVCLEGDPFRFSIRDKGSDDLFIFLQGGGACWSDFCLAVNVAPAGIPKLDVLDTELATNPLRDTSLVYLPYCDGSMFAGDTEHDDDGDGIIDRRQRGLANLTAALDEAKRHFPSPRRVVLAGSSGGSYGTILATLLVRTLYPGVPLDVFEDSGQGLANPDDPSVVAKIVDEFGVRPWLPASCTDCVANGHITRLVEWELAKDPDLRIGAFSAYADYVIADVFLQIPDATFEAALRSETGRIQARFPERYARFFVAGHVHTSLLGGVDGLIGSDLNGVTLPPDIASKLANIEIGSMDGVKVGDVSVATWMSAMLSRDSSWQDTLQ